MREKFSLEKHEAVLLSVASSGEAGGFGMSSKLKSLGLGAFASSLHQPHIINHELAPSGLAHTHNVDISMLRLQPSLEKERERAGEWRVRLN